MAYDAFISYSHHEDDQFAPVLQEGLQRIAKPWYRRRALVIFRDQTGLSANPGLWSSITEVLDDSEWFILLASPGAAESDWVNREVQYWLDNKDRTKLLPVVTNGDWVWDAAAGDFDWDACDAVPSALRGAFREEPRHIDLRWARREAGLTPRNPRLRDQTAEIAAPVHGVSKDELEGTDLREHRRTIRLARVTGAALVVLMVAAVIGGIMAARSASQARASQAQAEAARDESDFQRVVAQSRDLGDKDNALALLLAVEARHERDDPASRGAIHAALLKDSRYLGATTDASAEGGYSDVCLLGDGSNALTAGTDGTFVVTDVSTGAALGFRVRLMPASEETRATGDLLSAIHCAADQAGDVIVLHSTSGMVWELDGARQPRDAGHDLGGPLNDVAVSPDGAWIAAGLADGRLLVWATGTDPKLARALEGGPDAVGPAFSPDSATLVAGTHDELIFWDTATWQVRGRIEDEPQNQAGGLVPLAELSRWVAYSPNGRYLVSSRRGVTRMFDVGLGEVTWAVTNNYITALPFVWLPDSESIFLPKENLIARLRASDATEIGEAIPDRGYSEGGAVLRDGSTLLTWRSSGPAISNWALDGRTLVSRHLPASGRQPLSYSPDGRTLLAGPLGYSVVSATEAFDDNSLTLLAAVPDAAFPQLVDATTAAGYFVEEGAVDRVDLVTGRGVGPRFPVDISGAVQAANNLDGLIVVAYDNDTVRLFEPDGRQRGDPWLRADGFVGNMSVSPRGDIVAVNTEQGTAMFRVADATRAFDVSDDASLVTFTLDGREFAVHDGKRLRFFDSSSGLPTGKEATTKESDGAPLFSSGDLFAAVDSAVVELFDVASGAPVGDPFPNTGNAAIRPDGLELATTTERGIDLWDLDPDHWEAAACRSAGRNLTAAEWSNYFPNSGDRQATCPQYPLDD